MNTSSKFPYACGKLKDQAFLIHSVSSLAAGLGASALTLARTRVGSAASALNDSDPSSRLACFGTLWPWCFSSSSEQGQEEPEDYKPFGSADVRDPYSSHTLVPRCFLGQETLLVSSLPIWPVSLLQSKGTWHRMGMWWSENTKGKPAKTHHEMLMEPWAENMGLKSEILGLR